MPRYTVFPKSMPANLQGFWDSLDNYIATATIPAEEEILVHNILTVMRIGPLEIVQPETQYVSLNQN